MPVLHRQERSNFFWHEKWKASTRRNSSHFDTKIRVQIVHMLKLVVIEPQRLQLNLINEWSARQQNDNEFAVGKSRTLLGGPLLSHTTVTSCK